MKLKIIFLLTICIFIIACSNNNIYITNLDNEYYVNLTISCFDYNYDNESVKSVNITIYTPNPIISIHKDINNIEMKRLNETHFFSEFYLNEIGVHMVSTVCYLDNHTTTTGMEIHIKADGEVIKK